MPEQKNFSEEFRFERNLLDGNINRMYLEKDLKAIEYEFQYCKIRLERMFNICIEKFLAGSPVPEQGGLNE